MEGIDIVADFDALYIQNYSSGVSDFNISSSDDLSSNTCSNTSRIHDSNGEVVVHNTQRTSQHQYTSNDFNQVIICNESNAQNQNIKQTDDTHTHDPSEVKSRQLQISDLQQGVMITKE